MRFDKVEVYRHTDPLGRRHGQGDEYGFFLIPFGSQMLAVIASAGGGWDHVSVSKRNKTPTWEEMCFIKDLFWDESEVVVQYHPAKDDYVNVAKTCLHLWRLQDQEFPVPPISFV